MVHGVGEQLDWGDRGRETGWRRGRSTASRREESDRELAARWHGHVRGDDGELDDAPAVDGRVWRLGLDPAGRARAGREQRVAEFKHVVIP